MKQEIQMTLFILLFIAVYALMHYFVLSNLANYFGIKKNIWFYIVLSALTISFPLAMIFERSQVLPVKLTNIFYTLAAVWAGILFISFFVILISKLLFAFLPVQSVIAGSVILGIILVLAIASIINAQIITTKSMNIKIDNLNGNLKIVQLSDLHIGSINDGNFLEKVVEKTNAQKPDVVVITGDLVDGSAPLNKDIVKSIDNINAPIYYIIGNHETYEGLDRVMPILEKTKMNITSGWNTLTNFTGTTGTNSTSIPINSTNNKYFYRARQNF
jgi:uncharacterized protein